MNQPSSTTSSTSNDSPAAGAQGSRVVRFAVVQLEYQPAFKNLLFEPLLPKDLETSSLLPPKMHAAPQALQTKYNELRRRIRDVYAKVHQRKIEAILEACKKWNVNLVVFPEYSIPPELLSSMARNAGDMVVVAGSHYVDRETLKRRMYEPLDGQRHDELLQQSVSPILHSNRLLKLVSKLHPAKPELGTMKPGSEWEPVANLPPSIPGPMGVLICLDYALRQSNQHIEHIAKPLGDCRFLVAPAHTNEHSLDEMMAQALKDARRDHKPVFFANDGLYGGTTIMVDEERPRDLTMFPEHVGRLEAREEGIIVADVDVGLERRGPSTPYEVTPIVTPLVAASFVYRGIEKKYAQWLDAIHEKLDAPNKSDFDKLEDVTDFVKSKAPPLPGKTSARQRRLERLTQEVEHESNLERIRQWTTELVLPENILPMSAIWAALAQGAAKEVARWVAQAGAFGEVRDRLREPHDKLERGMNDWAEATRHAVVDIVNEVAGEFVPRDPKAQMPIVDVYEGDIDERFQEEKKEASRLYEEGRFADARVIYRRMLERAEKMLEMAISEEVSERSKPRNWVATFRLNVALSSLNLQEITEAREFLAKITTNDLDAAGRMHFAEAMALVGQVERARAVLPAKDAIPEKHHRKYDEVVQSLDVLDGRLPPGELVSDMVRLRAAPILLDKGDRLRVADYCLGIFERHAKDALMISLAAQFLTEALRRTIIEMPSKEGEIPVGLRGKIIEVLEKYFADFQRDLLPELGRASDRQVELAFRAMMGDKDWITDQGVWLEEQEVTFENLDIPRNVAFRIAKEGRLDEALQRLPNDHTWGSRSDRVGLLVMGKRYAQALEEVLVLAKEFPDRAPIESRAAELLHRNGRIKDALEYAQRAFEQLPSIGYRLHYVDLLHLNGDTQAAWDLLKGFATDKRPRMVRVRAVVAEKLGLLAEAESAWREYVDRRPKDGRVRVHYAELLFVQRKPEEAAVVAWSVFREQGDQLELDALFACGRLQRLSGALNPEQERRIKEIAAKIRERFPGEAKAEQLRFTLLAALGELPNDAVPIDFPKLVEGGYALKGKGIPSLMEYLDSRRATVEAVEMFRRRGAVPLTTSCAVSGARLALVVTRILERSRHRTGLLCPPVSFVDQPPAMQLLGATILVSDLELLLLEALKLIPTLRDALGKNGRLKLFERARNRILDDVATLRMKSRPDELQKKEVLLRKAERLRAIEADPNAPMNDAAAVRRAHGALVNEGKDGVDDGTTRISSRSFLQFLHEHGVLDSEQYKSILVYYDEESLPQAACPDPLPIPTVLPPFLVEQLAKVDALDAVFSAHGESLRLAPTVLQQFRMERDQLLDQVRAWELADRVHALLVEDWVQVITDEPPIDDLPKLRDQTEIGDKLIFKPLREMLTHRMAVLNNPEWWRLTAEFFGSTNLGQSGTMSEFAWENKEQYARLVQCLRQAATRDLTFPNLVRLLIHEEKASDAVLLKLAELGFPDALGAGELLRLEKRYGGLEKAEPKRILEHQEWMARAPEHLGGEYARLRLAQTYATAIFASYLAGDRTERQCAILMDALLRRQEEIGQESLSNTLEQTLAHIAGRTAHFWQASYKQVGDELILAEDGPVTTLWQALFAWSQHHHVRHAAHGRALRQVWRASHRLGPDGPPIGVSGALSIAHRPLAIEGPEFSLMDPGAEALAILSAVWKEKPLDRAGHGDLLDYGARLLAEDDSDDAIFIHGAREARYIVSFHGEQKPTRIRLPVDALLARVPTGKRGEAAKKIKVEQGPYDGIAYRLLERIEKTPEDMQALRDYADHAAGALFRLVQDDPSYLCIWPQSHGVNPSPQNKFRDLLETLSEPFDPIENFADDVNLSSLLLHRFYEGLWADRKDKGNLLAMASEIPGILPAIWIGPRVASDSYEEYVRKAFERLDRSDEYPVARITGDVMFLRVAAAHRPNVKLPEGEIDLRDILPARFLRLLEKVSAPPAPDTLAAAEPALLRVCADVMRRLTVGIDLSIKYALWLCYRLFQWLCLQLEAISPDARIQGLRELVKYAPPPRDGQDLLDPTSLSRDRFDHRLGTLLHAFGVMEDVVRVLNEQSVAAGENATKTTTTTKISISSSEFEDKLLDIAREPHLGPYRTSVLEWHGPGNVPDLALQALLRLSPQRLAEMNPESRMHRFKQLPDNPDEESEAEGRGRVPFAHLVLTSVASIASSLTPEERRFLEDKLRGMVDGRIAREWKWLVFVALFEAGADHLETDARDLTWEHLKHDMAPMNVATYVMGLAQRDVLRVEPFLADVETRATAESADVVNLVASALGRLRVHGSSVAQKLARTLLLQLAERTPFQEDDRMIQLIGFFGLRKVTS